MGPRDLIWLAELLAGLGIVYEVLAWAWRSDLWMALVALGLVGVLLAEGIRRRDTQVDTEIRGLREELSGLLDLTSLVEEAQRSVEEVRASVAEADASQRRGDALLADRLAKMPEAIWDELHADGVVRDIWGVRAARLERQRLDRLREGNDAHARSLISDRGKDGTPADEAGAGSRSEGAPADSPRSRPDAHSAEFDRVARADGLSDEDIRTLRAEHDDVIAELRTLIRDAEKRFPGWKQCASCGHARDEHAQADGACGVCSACRHFTEVPQLDA